ncbi:MAG TPA: hypothetical protein VJX74_18240 [Blastocatellia bacterium]|nr:hypothetical protein [Blastocatellia bacterium]
MKRLLVFCILVCALVVEVWAAGAAPANFSGTWVLDKTKSEGLSGMMAGADVTMVVTQDAKQLTSETTITGGQREVPPQKATYNLDGSETTAEMTGRMPGKATMKAKWMGDNVLELSSVQNVNVQGNDVTITRMDHWELAEGGKVLKVNRKSESPRGAQESKLVFNKK